MPVKVAYVASDLHLGSEFCYHESFLSWLDSLAPEGSLILNGDIVDDPDETLSAAHAQVLTRLVEESRHRALIWVLGNHDADLVLDEPGDIQFARHWEIDRRLLVLHGDTLDEVMPRHRYFKRLFKLMHRFLVALGFQRVHVAKYAKKWGFLYRVLNEHVARNALRAAKELGFEAVTCGHTHGAMVVERDGRRYFNTGAWTEEPLHFLSVDVDGIELRTYPDRAT